MRSATSVQSLLLVYSESRALPSRLFLRITPFVGVAIGGGFGVVLHGYRALVNKLHSPRTIAHMACGSSQRRKPTLHVPEPEAIATDGYFLSLKWYLFVYHLSHSFFLRLRHSERNRHPNALFIFVLSTHVLFAHLWLIALFDDLHSLNKAFVATIDSQFFEL